MLTGEEFQRRYEKWRSEHLEAALRELESVEVDEPICAMRFGSEWALMLTRAARCVSRMGVGEEIVELGEGTA